jgi:hypothetical protein
LFCGTYGTTKQDAEKGETLDEASERRTSGAEASIDSIALFAGDKSPAYRTNEFFRSLLKSCPFKTAT